MDQLPRLGKKELLFTLKLCGFYLERSPLPLGAWMGYVILSWHSLGLPYNYYLAPCTNPYFLPLSVLMFQRAVYTQLNDI